MCSRLQPCVYSRLLPYASEDSHHVCSGSIVEAPSGKLYAGRSLWGMLPAQEPRRSAIRLAELLVERPGLSPAPPRPRRLLAPAALASPHPGRQHTPEGSL